MKRFATRKIPTNIKNELLVEKRRQQIFEAVVKLFSKKGFHKTTLREISKESGITLGNLYDYISTKEDVLYLIQEKASRAIIEALLRDEESNSNPVERLKKLITSELDAMDKYQDLVLIIYQESHAMHKRTLFSLLRSERHHLEHYERVIQEGIDGNFFRPTNTRMMANMIKMLIDTWVLKRLDLRGKAEIDEMREGILGIVFDGIVTGKEAEQNRRKERNIKGEL
ncbi:MAG: hypothetical protein A2157_19105 [Deltaproteobacteria bacterium RBG_16_47_11]|nr:MAG: hypothetical protein A2157_19105 [Deltaproteobacteria bacterium RBG_16_47_11]